MPNGDAAVPTPLLPARTTQSLLAMAPGELQLARTSSAQATAFEPQRPLTALKRQAHVNASSRRVAPAVGESCEFSMRETDSAEERIARPPVAVKV